MTLKAKHFIDSHKCSNAPAILLMMWHFDAWSNPTAWVYLALHGTYGFLWTLKSLTFGDRQWEQPTSVGMGLATWVVLSLYWIAPWMITSRGIVAPGWYTALAVSIYAFGVFFHFASDMQKHMALALRPGHLLTGGLWSRCRNPNYFGELLIYGGFTMLAMSAVPLGVLALVVAAVWVPNMRKKDRSLSRYPEFAAYEARSSLIIPYVL
jgi:protein-S-isoprenylcysteine O-methyltransferase Ste14